MKQASVRPYMKKYWMGFGIFIVFFGGEMSSIPLMARILPINLVTVFYNLPKYLFPKILEKTLLMWLMTRPQIRRIPRPMRTQVLTLLILLIQPTPLVIPKFTVKYA